MRKLDITGNAPLVLALSATTEEEVIKQMIRALAGRPEIRDLQGLQRAVLERQKLQVPLLENGVALPHARTAAVTAIVAVIGRCQEAVVVGDGNLAVRSTLARRRCIPLRCSRCTRIANFCHI